MVLCEPSGRKLFGYGRGDRPEPLALARRRFSELFAAIFASDATELMARRAQATIGVLRSLSEELKPYEVTVLAKLGLPTRRGGREHLWFEGPRAHGHRPRRHPRQPPIDVDLRENTRGRHPLDLLTDWTIITPIGQVTPRSQLVARRLREHGAEVLEAMRVSGRPSPKT